MSFVAAAPIAPDHAAPITLAGLFAATLARSAERPALVGPGLRVTFRELDMRVRELAAGLRGLGIGPGDIVAAQLPNGPDFVTLYLAAIRLGATLQTLHMPYRAAELADLLGQSGARAVVALATFKDERPAALLAGLRASLPALRWIVAVGGPGPEGTLAWSDLSTPESLAGHSPLRHAEEQPQAASRSTHEGGASFETPTSQAPQDDAEGSSPPSFASGKACGSPSGHEASADHPMLLLYTSGTTANPKGVPNAHRGFLANARASAAEFGLTETDVVLAVAPFTHLYGAFALHLALAAGAASALLAAFTPAAFAEAVRTTRPTAIFAAPAHFAAALGAGLVRAEDFASVRTVCVSGSAVAPELARAIEAAIPSCRVVQLWGMSELQAGSYGRPGDPADLRHETAGRPSPGTELRVVDDEDRVREAGFDGRLQMRGVSLFGGYKDNRSATEAAFTADGWFDTGDTGRLRPDGALVLTGRVKEIINRGGVKFSPVDVELAVERMPAVARAAIVPMADPVLGERAALFVVPRDGAVPSLDEVTAHLAEAGIAKFKWPERIETVDAMPLTPTQKVMRGRLAALLKDRMAPP